MQRLVVLASLVIAGPTHARGVGAAGPTRVLATAADGGWVLMCQARKDTDKDGRLSVMSQHGGTSGDEQHAYLVIGDGDGQQIDDVVALDPTGRRAVILRNGRVVMIQPGLGKDLDLTSLGGAGMVQFTWAGDRLAYMKQRGAAHVIVIRDIATGKERVLDPGSGKLDSFYVHPGDRWIEARVFRMRKGDQPWRTSEDPGHGWCWTGFTSDFIQTSGTPPVSRVIAIDGGPARELADVVGYFGDVLMRRAATGALTIERPGAAAVELVPATCGGFVVATSNGAPIVACTKLGTPAPLYEYNLAKLGDRRAINATVAKPSADGSAETGRYLLDTGHDGGDTIIDLVTGKVRQSPAQSGLVMRSDRAIVQRGDKLVVIEPAGDRVLGAIEKYPLTFQVGNFVYAEPLVADVTTGTFVGTAPIRKTTDQLRPEIAGTVLGLAKDGRILVGYGGMQGRWGFIPGPLEWLAPVLPAKP